MSVIVLTDVAVTLNAVNTTPFTTSATLSIDVDDKETTVFGGGGWKSVTGGLKSFKLDMEFNSDFGASAVDQTIWPLLGTTVAFTAKPTSGSNSATNPQYSGNVLINQYSPIDGGVGDLGKTKVSWPGSGTLSRATA